MTKALIYACAVVVAASLAGCRSTGEVDYAGEVRVTSPELITIGPGVRVVADADEPLFFADGGYWLYRDGYWFRSDDYRGDFVRVDFSVVPEPLRGLEQPETYAHYRSRSREARPSPARTRSQSQAPMQQPQHPHHPSQPPMQHPHHPSQPPTQQPRQPSQAPTPQPSAPTPKPTLPSETSEPTDLPPPYAPGPPPAGESPARPTSPPGNAGPVQPGPTRPPVDEPDRGTPPAPSTDRIDAGDETKRLDEKKDPDTTDK